LKNNILEHEIFFINGFFIIPDLWFFPAKTGISGE
jgi:hypothetical protein